MQIDKNPNKIHKLHTKFIYFTHHQKRRRRILAKKRRIHFRRRPPRPTPLLAHLAALAQSPAVARTLNWDSAQLTLWAFATLSVRSRPLMAALVPRRGRRWPAARQPLALGAVVVGGGVQRAARGLAPPGPGTSGMAVGSRSGQQNVSKCCETDGELHWVGLG